MGYLSNIKNAVLGRPLASTSGYNAATNGRRMFGMGSSTRGVNALALADGPMLLARSRKLAMDNALATSAITGFVAETIGSGIRPHSKHSDPKKRELLEREFSLWTVQSSATRRIGAGGKPDSLQDFFGQQSLVCRNIVEAGEAFARFRYRLPSDLSPLGLRVPLQIDLIEPEQLAFWRMSGELADSKNLVRAGIEFNPIHERVAYHFYREHPGDSSIWPNAFEVTRVPASEVLHVMEFIRGNQIRGISSLAPIIVALNDLDEFDDAERYRQKLGAFMFAWRKTINPDNAQFAATNTVGNDTAPAGSQYVESQPGGVTVFDTNAGEEMDFWAHPGVATTYEPFMRVQHQQIATAMRVTYDMLTGDMNQVNYSSARIRLIALRRIWRQFQNAVMVHQFCRPVWRAWLDAAALAGVIDAADYRKNPEEYLNADWSAEPWEWVDPETDVVSVRMQIESALTSREAEVSKRGRRVEEVDAEIQRDHLREKKLGILPVYGKSTVTENAPAGDNPENTAPSETPAKPGQAPANGGKK
jgi:lambda family phage portal protein